MQSLFPIPDFQYLLFPALLLVYYLICWLAVGRDPKVGNVVPRYEPPAGVSPGVARYIVTGGSDGTSLAAVLAGLAAKGLGSIGPRNRRYWLKLLDGKTAFPPHGGSVGETLFKPGH